MLQIIKKLHYSSILASVLAMSLAACTGTQTANNPVNSDAPATPVATSSPQPPNSSNAVVIPGVNSITEVSFKPASKNTPGFFDSVNGSTAPTIQVGKAAPIIASGWAVLADKGRIPDRIIITSGDNNSLVAVVPITVERADVAKAFKNPAYQKSGWLASFNSSNLPTDSVVLKAWAYDSASKEATQLNKTFEVAVVE